jgi:TfoX/Sxy family transcriptional regulator of competence genes
MAYDEDLAWRIRELLGHESGLTEQRMFGGLSFLLDGNMAVAASGQGGMLVRVDPADNDELIATGGAEPMVMGGRSMAGWLRVPPEQLEPESELEIWVRRGVGYARSLPPKRPGQAKQPKRSAR